MTIERGSLEWANQLTGQLGRKCRVGFLYRDEADLKRARKSLATLGYRTRLSGHVYHRTTGNTEVVISWSPR